MSCLIWIQTVWHSDHIPERFFFKKVKFEKTPADDKIVGKFPRGAKSFKNMYLTLFCQSRLLSSALSDIQNNMDPDQPALFAHISGSMSGSTIALHEHWAF